MKTKKKMGQRIDPRILRLGISVKWKMKIKEELITNVFINRLIRWLLRSEATAWDDYPLWPIIGGNDESYSVEEWSQFPDSYYMHLPWNNFKCHGFVYSHSNFSMYNNTFYVAIFYFDTFAESTRLTRQIKFNFFYFLTETLAKYGKTKKSAKLEISAIARKGKRSIFSLSASPNSRNSRQHIKKKESNERIDQIKLLSRSTINFNIGIKKKWMKIQKKRRIRPSKKLYTKYKKILLYYQISKKLKHRLKKLPQKKKITIKKLSRKLPQNKKIIIKKLKIKKLKIKAFKKRVKNKKIRKIPITFSTKLSLHKKSNLVKELRKARFAGLKKKWNFQTRKMFLKRTSNIENEEERVERYEEYVEEILQKYVSSEDTIYNMSFEWASLNILKQIKNDDIILLRDRFLKEKKYKKKKEKKVYLLIGKRKISINQKRRKKKYRTLRLKVYNKETKQPKYIIIIRKRKQFSRIGNYYRKLIKNSNYCRKLRKIKNNDRLLYMFLKEKFKVRQQLEHMNNHGLTKRNRIDIQKLSSYISSNYTQSFLYNKNYSEEPKTKNIQSIIYSNRYIKYINRIFNTLKANKRLCLFFIKRALYLLISMKKKRPTFPVINKGRKGSSAYLGRRGTKKWKKNYRSHIEEQIIPEDYHEKLKVLPAVIFQSTMKGIYNNILKSVSLMKYILRVYKYFSKMARKETIFLNSLLIISVSSLITLLPQNRVITKKLILFLHFIYLFNFRLKYTYHQFHELIFQSRFLFLKSMSQLISETIGRLYQSSRLVLLNKSVIRFMALHNKNVNADFLVNYILSKLRQFFLIDDILNPLLAHVRRLTTVKSYRFIIAGRLTRKERAAYMLLSHGRMTPSTINMSIDYSLGYINLRFGMVSVRVFLLLKKQKPFYYYMEFRNKCMSL